MLRNTNSYQYIYRNRGLKWAYLLLSLSITVRESNRKCVYAKNYTKKELSFSLTTRKDNSRYLFKWLLNRYSWSCQITSYSFDVISRYRYYIEILTNTNMQLPILCGVFPLASLSDVLWSSNRLPWNFDSMSKKLSSSLLELGDMTVVCTCAYTADNIECQ